MKKTGARAKAPQRIKHAQFNFRPISSVSETVRHDKPRSVFFRVG